MAEIVVSAVVTVLIEKLLAGELMKFARSEGIDSKLKKLETTLPMIQVVLAHAAQRQITEKPVELWLLGLQDLAYDIEDVLDDMATEIMKRKWNHEESHGTTSKAMKIIPAIPHNFMYRRKISSKLDKITARLDALFQLKNNLGLKVNVKVERSNKDVRSQQTSYVNESKVFGREKDKDALIKQLLLVNEEACSNENVISVVSIVGMGGLGKTTLAQVLYNDQRVKDHFELMAWVCVSDEFNVFNISKQIYQAVGGDENRKFANLDLLHAALREKLSKKRFLVVLDDVWNEGYNEWDLLRSAFDVGAHGSKLLVTTRKKEVASVMGSLQPYMLQVLSDEISLSLLAQSSLGEQSFDNHRLKLIAQRIVEKCDGLPLALIVLGRVLKRKGSDDEWEKLLNSDIWNSDEKSGVLPALKVSYYDLPSHLKQVFAYCSLFLKDYKFNKKELVLLWMAQGFLSQTKGENQQMESLGDKYFEELLSRSFFQPSGDDKSPYIMHDLMNDLATSVAGDFFFRLDDNMDLNGSNKAYEKFRHFSFIGEQGAAEYKKFKELHQARRLRTFLPVSVSRWRDFHSLDIVTVELLPRLHFLRVLSLTNRSITEVPRSIGNLKHLRYLNFSYTDIEQIPEQVSELYNLQSLLVRGCHELSILPVNFAKLINLRHLDMTDTFSLKKLPLGIGGLKSLQTLSKVVIQEDNGFKISDLKDLQDLQGALSIQGLEKVTDPTNAEDANLEQKKGLDDLELVWGDATTNEDDVIEKLRPHSNLKTLCIKGYGGMKFPSWLGASFNLLTELVLTECNNPKELTLGHLTSLRKLEVSRCSKLESIKGEKEGVNVGSSIMGSLREVELRDCHSMESYCCPNSVEELKIQDCNLKELTLGHLTSLRKLKVTGCSKLKSIKGEKEGVKVGSSIMGSLREVTFLGCHSLESYCCPNSVERLKIGDCDSVTSLSFSKLQEDLPSSSSNLKTLSIFRCKNIKSISQEHLQSLTTLEDIDVFDCPSMEYSFPSCGLWPHNLKRLNIGELGKPMSEWEPQNYPSSLVELALHGKNSGVVSFGRMEEDHNNTSSACFLLPPSLYKLWIRNFEEVESVSEVLQHLPHLQHLAIITCPKLRDVPETTSSLNVNVSKW